MSHCNSFCVNAFEGEMTKDPEKGKGKVMKWEVIRSTLSAHFHVCMQRNMGDNR